MMSPSYITLLLSLNLVFCYGDRVVNTNVGSIRGYLSNDGYYQFLGIPYGSVPENNPFGISTPYPGFSSSSVFEANSDAVHCPQMPRTNVPASGVTDCLTLNVYIPQSATATSNLPVMVWIYGGYFHFGSASNSRYNPRYLVQHDVIFVSFNFRSGPYGFMCLNNPQVPGNQGLRDQYLAIQWVRDNIQAFGGNSNQITLAGHSSGAHSVNLHLVSERERLFHKVIMQSGSAFATTMLYPPDRQVALNMARTLGFDGNTTIAALRYLSTRDPVEVVTTAYNLGVDFKPCVERVFEGVEPFISQQWINATVPRVTGVPILIGTTENERAMTHLNQGSGYFENLDIFNSRLNQVFELDNATRTRMELYMRRFYIGDSRMSQDNVWNIINFDSDFIYNYPVQRSIRKFLESNAGSIYYYTFAYVGQRNINQIENNIRIDVTSHADDIGYLFERDGLPTIVTQDDRLIINRMSTLWTNFVKFSNPTPQTTSLLPVSWIPLTSDTYNYLRIDTNMTIERRPIHRRMAFFELFYRLNGNSQRFFEPTDAYEVEEDDGNSATIRSATFTTIALLMTLLYLLKH